jgi:D-methionine transport system ATP-binding protein
MIFQHFNLLSRKTVAENVAFPLRLAGRPASEVKARVAELLARVGLTDHAEEIPGPTVGRPEAARRHRPRPGDQARRSCCATRPPAPSTRRPPIRSSTCWPSLNRELKLTIVLITHEMDVVRRVCDQVAVMEAGVIVEQGPVADVFLHPKHPTTKRFVQESEQVDEGEQRDDFAHVPGRIVRLTFQGEATYAPLLGTVARETGVDYSILAGRIDRIKDVPYGQLTLAVTGGDMEAAFARFTAADVHMEVLR